MDVALDGNLGKKQQKYTFRASSSVLSHKKGNQSATLLKQPFQITSLSLPLLCIIIYVNVMIMLLKRLKSYW